MELGAVFWECPEEGLLFFFKRLLDHLYRLLFQVRLLLGLVDFNLLDGALERCLALAGHWRSKTIGFDFTSDQPFSISSRFNFAAYRSDDTTRDGKSFRHWAIFLIYMHFISLFAFFCLFLCVFVIL